MKAESEPVTPDETIIRLIWKFHYKPTAAVPIRYDAFVPKDNETTGISVFRAASLTSPDQALDAMAGGTRGGYAIAALSVAEVLSFGLTVQPDLIGIVSGHAIIPELNILAYRADKDRLRAIMRLLAEIASRNIIRRPGDQPE